MIRLCFVLGCLFAFVGVALGAFGAHILKNRLTSEMLDIFEVGVRYQMVHAFALFVVAWASSHWGNANFSISASLFVCGIILFSGSLYLLSLTGAGWLGAITPVGGMMFLLGWFYLALTIWRTR